MEIQNLQTTLSTNERDTKFQLAEQEKSRIELDTKLSQISEQYSALVKEQEQSRDGRKENSQFEQERIRLQQELEDTKLRLQQAEEAAEDKLRKLKEDLAKKGNFIENATSTPTALQQQLEEKEQQLARVTALNEKMQRAIENYTRETSKPVEQLVLEANELRLQIAKQQESMEKMRYVIYLFFGLPRALFFPARDIFWFTTCTFFLHVTIQKKSQNRNITDNNSVELKMRG